MTKCRRYCLYWGSLALLIFGSGFPAATIAAEPAAGLDAFQVSPGFHVQLVAAEPLLRDPVAMAFDEHGRLFVVEFPEYNQQFAGKPNEHRGSVRRLEDNDGDGRFDKSTIYVADLPAPSAVACYDGGVFVAAAPDLLYCKDTDGDGQADRREVVMTGFVRLENRTDPSLNSFLWGLDNRYHACTSYSGSVVRSVAVKNSKPRSIRNRGFLLDPRSLDFELTSGGGQHGLAIDDWGREFLCTNSSPVRMLMYDDRYIARNPLLKAPPAAVEISAGGKFTQLFRISPDEPWRVTRTRLRNEGKFRGSNEGGKPSGFFTSATGVTIYRGDAWPEKYAGSVFVGEPANNLVFRAEFQQDGVGLVANRADAQSEFLASADTTFRPVQFANAPDGCLYVIDMNRDLIEGAMFLPPDVLRTVDVSGGINRGRIYRIIPDNFQPKNRPMPGDASTPELVAMLAHRNGWHRDTASRLLYERNDRTAIEPLRALAVESRFPIARVTALYSLLGLNALSQTELLRAMTDPVPDVLIHALRLSENHFDASPALQDRLIELADHEDLRVRYQAAFSLGQWSDVSARSLALAKLAIRDGRNQWMRLAILSSVADCCAELFERLAGDGSFRRTAYGRDLLVSLSTQIGTAGHGKDIAAVIRNLESWPSEESDGREAVAVALLSGNRSEKSRELVRNGQLQDVFKELLERARRAAFDEKLEIDQRIAGIRMLSISGDSRTAVLLAGLLEPQQPHAIQNTAIQTLAQFKSPEVAKSLLARWAKLTPTLRKTATETMLARTIWLTALLDAIEDGLVGRGDLDPVRIELLKRHPDAAIADRVRKLFAASLVPRRDKVFSQYQPALSMAGDTENGRRVFKTSCSACHRLDGIGTAVGADLKAISDRGKSAILLNILDPNRDVKPQYVSYTVVTDEGRVFAGMIAKESVNSITIRSPDGTQHEILRVNIEALGSSGLSFMPEGLEKQIDQQAMADLLAWLMSRNLPADPAQPE